LARESQATTPCLARRRSESAQSGILGWQSKCKNEVRGMDFIFDRTANDRPIKMVVVLDEYTWENLTLEVARKFKLRDVIYGA